MFISYYSPLIFFKSMNRNIAISELKATINIINSISISVPQLVEALEQF
jgi:hypothetical protein